MHEQMIHLAGISLICHLVGDYVLQNHWVANAKTKNDVVCAIHVFLYTVPFLFITLNPIALLLIELTHFAIDRWRLAKYVVWASNQLAPPDHRYPLSKMMFSGHKVGTEFATPFFPYFVLFAVDNTMHVVIQLFILGWFL